jgi:lipid A 4'-phosphatase
VHVADPFLPEEVSFRRRFLVWTLALGAALGIIFLGWPEIDIEVARALRLCPGTGAASPWCTTDPAVEGLRDAFRLFTALAVAAVVVGAVRSVRAHGGLVGLAQARWWFLAATFAVGPGLVANVVLKDHWGRARPRQTVEFGGTKAFSPPLVPASECPRNCSFVSGEASATYIPFFAAALLLPGARITLIVGGIVAGTAAGLVRMAQGAHFLSDVLFAGLFMALTAILLPALWLGGGGWPGRRGASSRGPRAPPTAPAVTRLQ